jgi:hypothetical protein
MPVEVYKIRREGLGPQFLDTFRAGAEIADTLVRRCRVKVGSHRSRFPTVPEYAAAHAMQAQTPAYHNPPNPNEVGGRAG